MKMKYVRRSRIHPVHYSTSARYYCNINELWFSLVDHHLALSGMMNWVLQGKGVEDYGGTASSPEGGVPDARLKGSL